MSKCFDEALKYATPGHVYHAVAVWTPDESLTLMSHVGGPYDVKSLCLPADAAAARLTHARWRMTRQRPYKEW